jgi:hypothetical protein
VYYCLEDSTGFGTMEICLVVLLLVYTLSCADSKYSSGIRQSEIFSSGGLKKCKEWLDILLLLEWLAFGVHSEGFGLSVIFKLVEILQ